MTTKCQTQLEIDICPLATPYASSSHMDEEIMSFDEISCHWIAYIHLSKLILKVRKNTDNKIYTANT